MAEELPAAIMKGHYQSRALGTEGFQLIVFRVHFALC
jgi:hypothetical protein